MLQRDAEATETLAEVVRRASNALLKSERLPWADVRARQLRQRQELVAHSAANSPLFAARLSAAGLTPSDLEDEAAWQSLAVMTRRHIQQAGTDLFCRSVPAHHGTVTQNTTSGSTGEPITTRHTRVSYLIWLANAFRANVWHDCDVTQKVCIIEGTEAARVYDNWGPPMSLFGKTGPVLMLPFSTDVPQLVRAIAEFEASDLIIQPSTLAAIVTYVERHNTELPALRTVNTVGETLSPSLRNAVVSAFNVKLTDCYSSREVGFIALQCPDSGLYHVMAESLLVEVLDVHGRPCCDGQIGRVTLTDLHNYATPLVRYEIGDYAEVAAPCTCGRSLPTIRHVTGRERNLIRMPDGARHWPVIGRLRWREIAPVSQFQMIQVSTTTVDLRLVAERQLTEAEESRLLELIHECLGYPFEVRFQYTSRIERGPGGKFDQFMCQIPDDPHV